MPLRQIFPDETVHHPDLVDEIAYELELARADGPFDAPTIIEEGVLRSDRFSVTVIWDRWAAIPRQERGRVIMDAYQKARGREETLKISVALGLTTEEAARLGVSNGLENA